MTKTIIGAHADLRTSDYRFARHRSDDLPLEKLPAQEPWLHVIVAGVLMVAFMVAAFWATPHLADAAMALTARP